MASKKVPVAAFKDRIICRVSFLYPTYEGLMHTCQGQDLPGIIKRYTQESQNRI
jgi:hypothetical protein